MFLPRIAILTACVYNMRQKDGDARRPERKGVVFMDIQKIINDVIAKLKADPNLLKNFAANPVETLEKTLGIDLPDEQINQVIEGVKGKLDLSNIDLKDAAGLLGKLKGLFGK